MTSREDSVKIGGHIGASPLYTAEQLMGKIDRGYISCYRLLEKAVSLKLAVTGGGEPT